MCCHTEVEGAEQSFSPSHSILIPAQPVPGMTPQRQAPGRVATGVSIFKPLVVVSDQTCYFILSLHTVTTSNLLYHPISVCLHGLVGLVVRRPPRERKIPGSNPACAGIFSGSSHTSDLKIGTQVVTLPGAWRYRVSTGTGRPGVSIL